MKGLKYTIPLAVQISNEFHETFQKILSENNVQRASNKLSENQTQKRSHEYHYLNDIINLIYHLSVRSKRITVINSQLIGVLAQYNLCSRNWSKKEQLALIKQNLKHVFAHFEQYRKVAEIMEAIMSQGLASINKGYNMNFSKTAQGQIFSKFIDYLQREMIQLNRKSPISSFMASLQNLDDFGEVQANFKALSEQHRTFVTPIYKICLQIINKQFEKPKLQSTKTASQKKRSLFSFINGNQSKIEQQQSIIKRVKQESIDQLLKRYNKSLEQIQTLKSKLSTMTRQYEELKEPALKYQHTILKREPQQQKKISESYEFTINKLKNEIKLFRQKEKQMERLHQQNEKYRLQIQRFKFSYVDLNEEQSVLEIMAPFKAEAKRLQQQLKRCKSEAEEYKNIAEMNKNSQKVKSMLQKQNAQLKDQNLILRINQYKYKKNYLQLQSLLVKYEQNEKQLKSHLIAERQQSLQFKNTNSELKARIEDCKLSSNISKENYSSFNCTDEKNCELLEQNNRLKQQISMAELKLNRLLQISKFTTSQRQQKMAKLQLRIIDLTNQLSKK